MTNSTKLFMFPNTQVINMIEFRGTRVYND